jgi:hypothetical protein
MRVLHALSFIALAGLLLTSPAAAQQTSSAGQVSERSATAVDEALAAHDLAVDQQRSRLTDLLSTPEVRDLAGARGIDMERVEASAEGLSDSEVLGLAPMVERATKAMRAQQMGTVTISVAAIIIILLVLILVS